MKKCIFILCIAIFLVGCAKKDNDSFTDTNFKKWGIDRALKENILFIVIDSEKTLGAFSDWQKLGFVNPALKEFDIDRYPYSIAMDGSAIGLCASLSTLYLQLKNLNNLKVMVYIISPNDYGQMEKNLAYSFQFNRMLFNEINWSHFDCNVNDFQKITQNFVATPWITKKLNNEPPN